VSSGELAGLLAKLKSERMHVTCMKRRGVIEVTIGESGAVESVVMRQPTSTVFDDMLLAEARKWQYRPAKKDGAPVKYRKLIQFTLE